ncbi:hypothetical protein CC85DRAFT_153854 [Cutaneotrichosporon oleaginosum]|uniref:Uncharacterized protein n=1 Tax=Cutaneotrichosporon oleaginosum TaxID=879819 RepID=A0A0J1BB83_9TREE|nr:uncharacterized protein CC85DRAFT_153854 [Cutaneotrichosporon oleaginosum]KLT45259.1 hypothetical protein CC85DRAFT_153854 [Cutaneotrichosporon oleaginosum]TXT14911.1 hypothetical protein COLE_01104 [Cutaneotrichosporon oleaginosum]
MHICCSSQFTTHLSIPLSNLPKVWRRPQNTFNTSCPPLIIPPKPCLSFLFVLLLLATSCLVYPSPCPTSHIPCLTSVHRRVQYGT